MSEVQSDTESTRTRRPTNYYITRELREFKTRGEVEKHLTDVGGLREGESILSGRPVEAEQQSVFRLS